MAPNLDEKKKNALIVWHITEKCTEKKPEFQNIGDTLDMQCYP